MLLQCGNERLSPVTVALLGRFLPRLGPLPNGERPFFFLAPISFLQSVALFRGRRAIGSQFFHWYRRETIGEDLELARKLVE
jgi:hypothetical protein